MIGMGSFGKVSRGSMNGKLFVIKELSNSTASGRDKRLFRKEIELLAVVRGHDNVVNITAYADDAILLSYAEFSFSPLHISHQPAFNVSELLHACDDVNDFEGFQHFPHFLCVDIISGLHYLHSHGIVHRDLKPENVLVCNRHYSESAEKEVSSWWSTKPVVAKLTDFGESRSAVTSTRSLVCTHTSDLYRGSPAYMAPEALLQLLPQASLSDMMRMDIWSLGMTVFNLINPDIGFPFQEEVSRQEDVSAVEVLQKCVAKEILPTMSPKYSTMRKESWEAIEAIYRACALFDRSKRPDINELATMAKSIEFNAMCSQKSRNSETPVTESTGAGNKFDRNASSDKKSQQISEPVDNGSCGYVADVTYITVGGDGGNRNKGISSNPSNVDSSLSSMLTESSSSTCVLSEDSQNDDIDIHVACVSDDETDLLDVSNKRNRYINNNLSIDLWNACPEENVLSLPFDLDGLRKFRIECKREQMMDVTKDGRPWAKWNSSKRKFFTGVRRIARCKGGYICLAEFCPFVKLHQGPNKVQFKREGGVVVCFSCGKPANAVACPATKIWEYHNDAVVVMHIGLHSCQPKARTISRQQLIKVVKDNPGVKPSKLINGEMIKLMTTEDFSWENVEKIAESFTDLKRIHNVKADVQKMTQPLGNNFEALAWFKKKCDERDKYLIFRVNSRDLNGEPSYVFKASKSMAELAVSMDKDREGEMRFEYAHVDAKHDRCRGFVTITLWAYNDVLRKLVCLSVMEAEEENTTNLSLFWKLHNEMLEDVSQIKGYKFNPYGFVADEHHANWASIKAVFGERTLERVVSCEFHFKQSVERQAKKLEYDSSMFKSVAHDMLQAVTCHEFNLACSQMQVIVDKNRQLQSWFSWWFARRTHIFRAFKVPDAPSSNLAEVGHSKMQNVGRCYMSLLDAAREDVACALRQQTDLRVFSSGMPVGGRGKSHAQRQAIAYKAAMKRASAYAAELDECEIAAERDSVFVPTTGIHRPPEKKFKRVKKGSSVQPSDQCEPSDRSNSSRTILAARAAVRRRLSKKTSICLSTVNRRYNTSRQLASKQRKQAEKRTFHLVLFGTVKNLKKCYGCNNKFVAKHKKPPNDLILKHFCLRQFVNNEGVTQTASFMSAAYFHLNVNCTRMRVPNMEINDIVVHDEVLTKLSVEHKRILENFGMSL
jgi:serine/threonine protein kinase